MGASYRLDSSCVCVLLALAMFVCRIDSRHSRHSVPGSHVCEGWIQSSRSRPWNRRMLDPLLVGRMARSYKGVKWHSFEETNRKKQTISSAYS